MVRILFFILIGSLEKLLLFQAKIFIQTVNFMNIKKVIIGKILENFIARINE